MLQKGDPTRIVDSTATKEKKILLLWMITRLEYRGPIGEEAFQAIAKLIPDEEIRNALVWIAGFSSAKPEQDTIIQEFARLCAGVLF